MKRNLKKGIWYSSAPGKTALEKFQAAKAAGFDGIEPPSHLDQDEVLRARDASGLAIPSVSCGQHSRGLASPDAAKRDEAVAGIKQALRDAKRYGASSILVVPGGVNEQVTYAEAYRRAQDALRKAVPLAEELGVKIALENVWNQFLLSPLEAARYVDEFNSPWVGWHFDVGNILKFGFPEQWIRILNKRIIKIHLKEYSAKRGFDVEFLKGDDDWPSVMKALDEIGSTGWAIAEQGGADSLEGLKKLAGEIDRILES